MKYARTYLRPGFTAIAAVTALSATPLLAQTTTPLEPPVVSSAPAAPAAVQPSTLPTTPAAPPAAAPTTAPPLQTVQSIPQQPKLPDLGIAETESAPATAEGEPGVTDTSVASEETSQPQAAPPSGARSAPDADTQEEARAPSSADGATSTSRTSTPEQSMAEEAAPAEQPMPVIPVRPDPMVTATPSTPVTEPQVSEQAESGDTDVGGWVLLGGGLLLVAGGAAFALRRRRSDAVSVVSDQEQWIEPVRTDPVIEPAPRAPARSAARETAPLAAEPVARANPAPAAAFAKRPRRDEGTWDEHRRTLETMAAEAPSEANPFRTRRSRLRRADFLLRTGEVSTAGRESAPMRETEAAEAGDRWSQTRFGTQRPVPISWKPARR